MIKWVKNLLSVWQRKNTGKRCEISSKLIIKTPGRCNRRSPEVFMVNFEHIAHFFLLFLLLNLCR